MLLKANNKVDTNRYELEIVIDDKELEVAVAAAYKKNADKIALPGFRKGKAPRSLVERMYGAEFFYEDALNILYPDAVEFALKEADLEIVSNDIGFDLVSMDKSGVDFKITVTVKPEVEMKGYKGIKAEKLKAVVTDEEVDQQVKNVAERNARLENVTDRAAAMDDTVVIDFEGFTDGKAFEGGKAEGYSLKLGSNSFIPGFEDQIVGHSIDEEFDVNVTFPEEYHAEELKGKPAVFKIKLHEIKVTELPVIDDEFAKDVSEFDTLDEYKADLKAKLLDGKTKSADDAVEDQLMQGIIDNVVAEIPDAMIESKMDENVQSFGYRLQMQGMDLNTYVKYMGGDMAAFRESFRGQAEKQVKLRLALEKIAVLENLVASEDEINAEYEKYAKDYNMELENIKAAIPETELVKDIVVGKAMTFVRENADIVEVDALSEKKPAAKKPAAKKSTSTAKAADGEKKPAAKKTSTSTAKKSTSTAKAADGEKKPAAKKTTSTSTAKKTTSTAKKTTTKKAETEEK